MTLKFTIPGEPQGQGRPRFARRGKHVQTYDPEKSVNYKAFVGLIAADAVKAQGWQYQEKEPVCVTIYAYMSVPESKGKKFRCCALEKEIVPTKKPDIDNIYKAVTDAMSGIVYSDDKQVVAARIAKLYGEQPRVEVEVSPWGGLI